LCCCCRLKYCRNSVVWLAPLLFILVNVLLIAGLCWSTFCWNLVSHDSFVFMLCSELMYSCSELSFCFVFMLFG
jgi:hypothetical protein